MMVDLSSFSDENFEAKKWINTACQSRHPQDPLENHLVDLEMKLQMISEEISASLEEQSAAALLRVPRASRDVIRLRDDALSLRQSVASIIVKLKKAEGSSAESIATLAKVDTVKRRMEAAYETLQDAAGLTQLSSTVEDVFASGDLPRAAETLANMRHCLSAVGEVAEFANVRKQLEVLEDRLDTMVQPRLTDALNNRKAEVAQDLRGILIRIGRSKSLEMYYAKVHLKPLKQLWENFDSRQHNNAVPSEKNEPVSFLSWLPSFYDELLLYLEQEWKWAILAFPEDYKTFVPKLLNEFMAAVSGGFVSRLNLATCEFVPDTKALAKGILDILLGDVPKGVKVQTKHLEALMIGSFARNIRHLFSEIDLKILMETLEAVVGVGSEWLAFVSQVTTSISSFTGLPTQFYVRKLFKCLGATYIKRGQIMLSASTLFPSEHVKEFQYYFDRAHAVPFEKILNSMREEFYEFDDGVFEFVDPTLVTSASIAQVHGVRFRGFLEGVVIEAWNPGIKDILVAGLNLVFIVARIIEILNTDLSRISLVYIVARLDISGKKNVQIFDPGGCIILTSLRTRMFLRGRNCNKLGIIGPSGLVAMTNWSPCQVKPKGA